MCTCICPYIFVHEYIIMEGSMEEFILVYLHGILLQGSQSQAPQRADPEVKTGTQEA